MEYSWKQIPFIVSLLILSMFSKLSNQSSYCPIACHQIACQTGVLSCTDGGLVQIPTMLPLQTTKIILSNQRFFSAHLSYSNISNYGPPQYRVMKITIQNCELRSIASNSFSHLSDLNILDLSNNYLLIIAPDTFRSLNLKFLRLDGNRNILFTKNSFRGLIVTELSLIDCTLKELNYEAINEISGSLKKLILTNNKLRTIEKRFRNIFESLPNLQINDNPFNCTCSLNWLGSVLLWRKKRFETLLSSNLNNEAQCSSPMNVKGKKIIDLSPKHFSCDLPKLRMIDVNMTSNISAKLTCSSEHEIYSPPSVIWMTVKNDNYVNQVQSKEKAALLVWKQSNIDQFKCVIVNENGNVTVWISIHWPQNISENTSHSLTTFNTGSRDLDQKFFIENSTTNVHIFLYVKRFTLLEMIGGVVGTFTITMILFLCIYRHLVMTIKRNDKKKWYISYEAAVGSDSQTYDIPHNTTGPYYPGQLLTNHYSPARYLDYNSHTSHSTPNKIAAL